jgi:hypothetical protein
VKSHEWHRLGDGDTTKLGYNPVLPSFYFGEQLGDVKDTERRVVTDDGAWSCNVGEQQLTESVNLLDDRRWRFPYPVDGKTQTDGLKLQDRAAPATVVMHRQGDAIPPTYPASSSATAPLFTPYHFGMYGESNDCTTKETQLRAECMLISDTGGVNPMSLIGTLEGSETSSALLRSTDALDVCRSLVRQIIAPAMAGHSVPSLLNRLYAGFRANLSSMPLHSETESINFTVMPAGVGGTHPTFKFGAMQKESQIGIEEALVVGRPTHHDGMFLKEFLLKMELLRSNSKSLALSPLPTALGSAIKMATEIAAPVALADIGGATPRHHLPNTPPATPKANTPSATEVPTNMKTDQPVPPSGASSSTSSKPSATKRNTVPSPRYQPSRPQSARNVQLAQRNMRSSSAVSSARARPSTGDAHVQNPVSPRTKGHLVFATKPALNIAPTTTLYSYDLDRKSRGPSLSAVMSVSSRQLEEQKQQNKSRLRRELLDDDSDDGDATSGS